jgi:hypothetical protein
MSPKGHGRNLHAETTASSPNVILPPGQNA